MRIQTSRRDFLRVSAGLGAGAALAACAPAAPPPPAAEQPAAPEATAAPAEQAAAPTVAAAAPAGAPIEMSILLTGDTADMQKNLQPYLDQHPEINLTLIGVAWDGFDQKTDLLIAGGEPPVVWYCAANRDYIHYAVRDLLADLGPYVERDNFDLSDFHQGILKVAYFGGKLMGFPCGTFPTFLVYNKDLFDKAGVAYPPDNWEDKNWTWDEFVAKAQALTKPGESSPLETIWGFGGSWDTRYDTIAYGEDIFRQEDYALANAKSTLVTTEPVMAVYQAWQDYIWKYKITPSPEVVSSFGAVSQTSLFLSGLAAIDRDATWSLPTSLAEITDFQWDMAPFPVNGKNDWRNINYTNHWVTFKNKNQDQTWDLLKYMVSDDAVKMGIEMQGAGQPNNVTTGGMVTKMSLVPVWADMVSVRSKKSPEEISKLVFKALDYSHVFLSLATVKWGEVWDVGMKPEIDKILLNKTTVAEAVQVMDAKTKEILAAA
jgi:multiple sugar transport system substrate-binding protein